MNEELRLRLDLIEQKLESLELDIKLMERIRLLEDARDKMKEEGHDQEIINQLDKKIRRYSRILTH